jgi:hypothetical protein
MGSLLFLLHSRENSVDGVLITRQQVKEHWMPIASPHCQMSFKTMIWLPLLFWSLTPALVWSRHCCIYAALVGPTIKLNSFLIDRTE